MSGRFLDTIDGGSRNALQWPVACWKSPSLPATAPGTYLVPSPIPPHAFVDYAMESLGTEASYLKNDHVRLQRAGIGGANDFFHPAWIASKQSMALLSGGASNAFYVGNKVTGVGTALTDPNWNQRLYGAWPMLRDGGIHQRPGHRNRQEFRSGGVTKILRRRVDTPWVQGVAAAKQYLYDLRNWGHSDEPAFIQLWGKCISPDLGYQVGQETPIKGLDGSTGGGGEVFYNGNQVGFVHVAAGFWGVNIVTGAVANFTPAKWMFQLRMCFASDADDALDPRMHQGRRAGMVAFWRSIWVDVPRPLASQGQAPRLILPENFNPIDMQIVLRAKVGTVASSLWNHNDQLYSTHPGYLSNAGWQNWLVDGRNITLPWDTAAYLQRDGTGGVTFIRSSAGQLEFQIRAIG